MLLICFILILKKLTKKYLQIGTIFYIMFFYVLIVFALYLIFM